MTTVNVSRIQEVQRQVRHVMATGKGEMPEFVPDELDDICTLALKTLAPEQPSVAFPAMPTNPEMEAKADRFFRERKAARFAQTAEQPSEQEPVAWTRENYRIEWNPYNSTNIKPDSPLYLAPPANAEATKCVCGQPAEFCGHCVTAVVRPNDEAVRLLRRWQDRLREISRVASEAEALAYPADDCESEAVPMCESLSREIDEYIGTFK